MTQTKDLKSEFCLFSSEFAGQAMYEIVKYLTEYPALL